MNKCKKDISSINVCYYYIDFRKFVIQKVIVILTFLKSILNTP